MAMNVSVAVRRAEQAIGKAPIGSLVTVLRNGTDATAGPTDVPPVAQHALATFVVTPSPPSRHAIQRQIEEALRTSPEVKPRSVKERPVEEFDLEVVLSRLQRVIEAASVGTVVTVLSNGAVIVDGPRGVRPNCEWPGGAVGSPTVDPLSMPFARASSAAFASWNPEERSLSTHSVRPVSLAKWAR